jgi:hypothetical protein
VIFVTVGVRYSDIKFLKAKQILKIASIELLAVKSSPMELGMANNVGPGSSTVVFVVGVVVAIVFYLCLYIVSPFTFFVDCVE